MSDKVLITPRCPKCGYTLEDCQTEMDHHLCGEPMPGKPYYDYPKKTEPQTAVKYQPYDILVAGTMTGSMGALLGISIAQAIWWAIPLALIGIVWFTIWGFVILRQIEKYIRELEYGRKED